MKHQYFAATLAVLALGCIGFVAPAAVAASPVGYWLKEDGAAKLEISQCGSNQLCSKIVWLRDPLDSQGRPLHDARNENPSLRGRPIIGLPIFQGLAPAGGNTWKGHIYNPEDGGTYKATLTLVSSNQIVLKGCLAMFLCGQKTWTRTAFEPTPVEPEEPRQIEVKESEPEPAPEPRQQARAEPEPQPAAEPEPRRVEASAAGMPMNFTVTGSLADEPSLPTRHDETAGFNFVLTEEATSEASPKTVEGEASTMFVVSPAPPAPPMPLIEAKADASEAVTPQPRTASRPEPRTEPRPTQTARAEPVARPQASYSTAASVPSAAPEPQAYQAGAAGDIPVMMPLPQQRPPEIDVYAEAEALAAQPHLTWRDRRRLRKLRRELPWLQQPGAQAQQQVQVQQPVQAQPQAQPQARPQALAQQPQSQASAAQY